VLIDLVVQLAHRCPLAMSQKSNSLVNERRIVYRTDW